MKQHTETLNIFLDRPEQPHDCSQQSCFYLDHKPHDPIYERTQRYGLAARDVLQYSGTVVVACAITLGIVLAVAVDSNDKYNPHRCGANDRDKRHVYFDTSANTALLFLWCAFHFVLLLAFTHRALYCLLRTSWSHRMGMRWRVFGCFLINSYGLVYGWWVIFNYINDARSWTQIGTLWPSQLFFSVSDLLPAYMCYRLLPGVHNPSNEMLLASASVSLAHVVLALWDQGAIHLTTAHPLAIRDAMFLLSDLAGLLLVVPFIKGKSSIMCVKTAGLSFLLSAVHHTIKTSTGGY